MKSGVYKWSAIDRVCNSAMTFTGNIVLANLLDPSDFGLVAMVAIFSAIAQNLSSCGMSDGLIHKAHPTERDYSTVFVFNAVLGLVFGSILCLLGMPLSRFFGHQEINGIMIATGICFFFMTMSFAQETRMRKELDMKRMAIVRLSSTASATVLGIWLALEGFGYWALVATQTMVSVFSFVFYVLVSRWFPRIAFYMDSFREMFSYGVHLMFAYVSYQIGRNINTAMLGRFSTPVASGLYSQAQKLEEVPFSITESVFNWPFFSVLCNEESRDGRCRLSSQMHSRLWVVNFTIGALLLIVSLPAFNLLYGSKWDAAVPVFRLLIVYGISVSIKLFYQTVFKAHGRTKLVRNLTFAEVILQIGFLAIALWLDGSILMVAFTQVLAALVMLAVHALCYCSIMDVSLRSLVCEALRAISVPLAALLLMAALYLPVISLGELAGVHARLGALIDCTVLTLGFCLLFIAATSILKPTYYPAMKTFFANKLHIRI